MNQPELYEIAKQSSRKAGRIAAFGGLVTIVTFALAIWQLLRLDQQLADRRKELLATTDQIKKVEAERNRLLKENTQLKSERQLLKQNNRGLEEVVRLQQDRDYTNALAKIEEILRRDPGNEVAYCYGAHSCYQLGRYSDATTYALKSISIDTNYFDPYAPLVCSLTRTGRKGDAVLQLRAALNLRLESLTDLVAWKRYFDDLWATKETRDVIVVHQRKIMAIQAALRDFGYYACPQCQIDGIVGAGTRAATARFGQEHGIPDNSTVDEVFRALAATKAQQQVAK